MGTGFVDDALPWSSWINCLQAFLDASDEDAITGSWLAQQVRAIGTGLPAGARLRWIDMGPAFGYKIAHALEALQHDAFALDVVLAEPWQQCAPWLGRVEAAFTRPPLRHVAWSAADLRRTIDNVETGEAPDGRLLTSIQVCYEDASIAALMHEVRSGLFDHVIHVVEAADSPFASARRTIAASFGLTTSRARLLDEGECRRAGYRLQAGQLQKSVTFPRADTPENLPDWILDFAAGLDADDARRDPQRARNIRARLFELFEGMLGRRVSMCDDYQIAHRLVGHFTNTATY